MKTLPKFISAVVTAVLLGAALLTTAAAGAAERYPCAAHPSTRCAELGIKCLPQPPKHISWICVKG